MPFYPHLEPMARPMKEKVPLTHIYNISHRKISLKLDTNLLTYKAQLIINLELKPDVDQWLNTLQNFNKVSVELKLNVKQAQVTSIWELNGKERGKKFKFDENNH